MLSLASCNALDDLNIVSSNSKTLSGEKRIDTMLRPPSPQSQTSNAESNVTDVNKGGALN